MAKTRQTPDSNGLPTKETGETVGTQSFALNRSRQKVDDLVDIIHGMIDEQGLFDPKRVVVLTRGTELEKSASTILSILRRQGFVIGDQLRVPVSNTPDLVKKFINVASTHRKKGIAISFEDAVALARSQLSESPDQSGVSETKPPVEDRVAPFTPAETDTKTPPNRQVVSPATSSTTTSSQSEPVPTATVQEADKHAEQPEIDFRALYEESRNKVLTLEAELQAYKSICLRLIDTLKK